METLLDSGSPRRGSLSSLHRQSTGSSHYSHNSKLASPGSANNSHHISPNNNNSNSSATSNPPTNSNLSKDLDKFTRYFIIKTVQVIVQSRIGGSKRVRMDCKPSGNDWFNINISDIPEVREITKAALDTDGFTVKSNWRVCCEISLKTNDGSTVVLEHWIISNKYISNQASNSSFSSSKLAQTSPKTPPPNSNNRNSSPINTPISNHGNSPLSALNNPTQQSPTRTRTATFSNTTRTRLNSIEDCSGDNNYLVNRLLVGANNENADFKASKSCYSLSNSPAANRSADQNHFANTIAPSPSINSLPTNTSPTLCQTSNNNNPNAASTTMTPSTSNSQGQSKSHSSIFTIYNRMSLLLKTLMTTTHIVPAYRLALRTSPPDPCVICYRVYTCLPSSHQSNRINRGSIENINYNANSESPNKRSSSSSSNSSFDSINIRDFVSVDELDHFCPILKLGSIKTEINELDVSVCYRTDVRNSNQLLKNPALFGRVGDEDCIIAAKQLLAGNDYNRHHQNLTDNLLEEEDHCQEALNYLDQPLRPAFAQVSSSVTGENSSDPNLELVESAFDGLLKQNNHNDSDKSHYEKSRNGTSNNGTHPVALSNAQSQPIQVPKRSKYPDLYPENSVGSTPKSLTESFVFVELNPPFASEEQNDIATFFHGPSPVFSNGFDSLKDVDELTHQLADLEANASQLDEFVDNICMSDEENKEEC